MTPARRAGRLAARAAAALALAGLAWIALRGDGDPLSACREAAYRDPVTGRAAARGGADPVLLARCRRAAPGN